MLVCSLPNSEVLLTKTVHAALEVNLQVPHGLSSRDKLAHGLFQGGKFAARGRCLACTVTLPLHESGHMLVEFLRGSEAFEHVMSGCKVAETSVDGFLK